MVLQAREPDEPGRQALGELFSKYWYPVYAFIRRSGLSPHEAEDLTQEFFFRVLQRDWLANVHPTKGKFRSFLLVCVKNFLANYRDKQSSQKRGGGSFLISLAREDAETRYSLEPADPLTPDVLFERQWALELLEQTIAALRREYAVTNRLDWFDELQGFLPGGIEKTTRAALGQGRGLSPNAVDVAIHRIRQRFGSLLRQRVAETVSSDSEIDEEIRHLMNVLGK